MSSYEFDLVKRAFQEHLDRVGIDIISQDNFRTRKCVTGAIERKRAQELIGVLPDMATKVDMLADDFDDLEIVSITSTVRIDGIDFRVLTIERDPMDPAVHFLVTAI